MADTTVSPPSEEGLGGLSIEAAETILNNPHAPWDSHKQFLLAGMNPDLSVRCRYAEHVRKPLVFQAALVDDSTPVEVLVALGRSPYTDPSVLTQLGIQMDPSVRVAVALNPRCPMDTLRTMLIAHPLMDTGNKFVALVAREVLHKRIEEARARLSRG